VLSSAVEHLPEPLARDASVIVNVSVV
jgi:hypothetical protein